MKITYYGHSFFGIKTKNKNILIDPFLEESKQIKRIEKCAIKEENLKKVNLILITHDHFDHFEKNSVERIALKNNSVVVAHESILKKLKIPDIQKKSIKVNDELNIRDAKIKVMPAHHPQAFYPVGYLIDCNGKKVYHAGDTSLMNQIQKMDLDVALIPIGGTYTMDVIDAVRTIKILKPKITIPMHYNTFEVIKTDPRELKEKISDSIIDSKVIILKPGKSIKLK